MLIIAALVFGSRETVNVFGFNIYMVQSDAVSTAPKDSAVIVRKCSAFELDKGNLVLYTKDDESKTPVLGYVRNIEMADGAYYVTAFADGTETRFSDPELVGRAEYSSLVLGKVIAFIRTPWGVLCLAVIPCIVLIIYDILRAAAAKMPPPEVVPQVKNGESAGFEDENGQLLSAARTTGSKLSVNGDGKAILSRKQGTAQPGTAADVLFSYAARQKKTEERPIIPLTDKKSEVAKPAIKLPEKPSSGYTSIININENTAPKPSPIAEPKTPNNVAVSRYAQNTSDAKPASKPQGKVSGKTAELPDIPAKKDTSDAFFVQTNTPSFSEETLKRYSSSSAPAPQLGAKRDEKSDVAPGRTARTARKRSTQIIASKSMDELFADDDDTRSRHRRASGDSVVNDILAEAEKKK